MNAWARYVSAERFDLVAREARAAVVLPGRVAHHRGEVADEEDGRVPQVLELPHLLQQDGVAEVQVGTRGVEARLDAQRAPARARLLEPLLELRAHVEVDDTALEERELLGDRRKRRP